MRLRNLLWSVLLAGCAHVQPASTEGVPPPWPAPDAPISRKGAEPASAPGPEGEPVVPPLKPTAPVPVPPPHTPQSAPDGPPAR